MNPVNPVQLLSLGSMQTAVQQLFQLSFQRIPVGAVGGPFAGFFVGQRSGKLHLATVTGKGKQRAF